MKDELDKYLDELENQFLMLQILNLSKNRKIVKEILSKLDNGMNVDEISKDMSIKKEDVDFVLRNLG